MRRLASSDTPCQMKKMDYTQQGNRLPFQCIFSYGFYLCDSGANLRVFTKERRGEGGGGNANLKKILILRPK